jgi:primosomal protein N' (replication factor Y)
MRRSTNNGQAPRQESAPVPAEAAGAASPQTARYCDVALPVPIDRTFTYAAGDRPPVIGGRVLVPFRKEQMQGIVVAVHNTAPGTAVRPILQSLDREPALPPELLRLGEWIAQYYVAPLGEVLRTMLPLNAELRRKAVYRMGDKGHRELQRLSSSLRELEAADTGRRRELLEFLAGSGAVPAGSLRRRFALTAADLQRMTGEGLLERDDAAEFRDARPMLRFAALVPDARLPRLNANQERLLSEIASRGRVDLRDLRALPVPASTLATLVRRNLVTIEEEPASLPAPDASAVSHASAVSEERLNATQHDALLQIAASVEARRFQAFLLHGVTGSGKTAVYIAAMRRVLQTGRCSLMLVPEIGLTPAMIGQVTAAFGDTVAVLHSSLSPGERSAQWRRIRAGQARIVIGTRSAIFAPIPDLALLLVDEEHDASYKQSELPRYHARDIAVKRASDAGATVVLGSATPSLESWSNALRGKYTLLSMQQRVSSRPMPDVSLIDMRQEFLETGADSLVSRQLAQEIQATLDRGEQAMLLLNRRGYSFVAMCRACGEKLQCENCAIALTHHKLPELVGREETAGNLLQCHYCGFRRAVPRCCPHCNSEHIYFFGIGSQQGEERLQQMFPEARIGRMDRDTMRSHRDFERMLQRLRSGAVNLLVGTQMIAKGHDIHGVTLVGVLGVDHTLGLPDFRSAERAFQLLTQAAGRAGRGDRPGRVLVQTHYPEHYAMRHATQHDYLAFAQEELRYRRLLHYPPAALLANVLLEHTSEANVMEWTEKLREWFGRIHPAGVRVLGPAPAPLPKIKRVFRHHLLLKSGSRQQLAQAVRELLAFAESAGIPRRHLTVDMDPVQLM